MESTKSTILFATLARFDESLRKSIQLFLSSKIYIIHTRSEDIHDPDMKRIIAHNIQSLHDQYLTLCTFIPVSLYGFYQNVQIFRWYFQQHIQQHIICDLTVADKIISDALLYARLLEFSADITVVYHKRDEDLKILGQSMDQYIVYPVLPSLTNRQLELMSRVENGKNVSEIATTMHITKNNVLTMSQILRNLKLLTYDEKHDRLLPTMPVNYYYIPHILSSASQLTRAQSVRILLRQWIDQIDVTNSNVLDQLYTFLTTLKENTKQ